MSDHTESPEETMLTIRPARTDELERLSDLCLRSKAVWGYDQAFLAACKDELSISKDDLLTSDVVVAEAGHQVIAVAQLLVDRTEADLGKLFVDPDRLGTGAGRRLFEWACATARAKGAETLIIDSDPDA
ncbi:MAG: GNAT family N-acetyltransferase, partial [Aestuariivirgaceae bacterium]